MSRSRSSPELATYGLIGAGGFGRQTMPLLAETLANQRHSVASRLVFVVEGAPAAAQVNGYPILSLDEFLNLKGPRFFNIAIGDGRVRERISSRCLGAGVEPMSLTSRFSDFGDSVTIGPGAIFCPFTIVSSNATVGRFFHANHNSSVGHDCVVGDFVTFSPGVRCNGRIQIGDYAVLGTGAMLMPGTTDRPLVIGEGAVVGMGAVVLRDIAPHTTVVGNPARPLMR
jgi:sugar O-acyltransferase (sialic acid O-acetyltransferase NeuD family)